MAGLSIASMVLQGIGDLIKGFNGTDEVKDVSNGLACVKIEMLIKFTCSYGALSPWS